MDFSDQVAKRHQRDQLPISEQVTVLGHAVVLHTESKRFLG